MMRFSTSHLTASCAFFLFPSVAVVKMGFKARLGCLGRKQGGRKESRRVARVSRAGHWDRQVFPDRGLLCLSF